ncbi:MAG: hypothetical protein M8319_00010 [Nitrosopumilus sp.]|nr:hypothetical protein [Nitrosopumilus sp.]
MDSVDEISQMFQTESEKLENLINNATSKSELSIHEIVETYYQVMNVSSMITMLKPQITGKNQSLLEKLEEIEQIIFGKFNSDIHPKIMDQLTNSIQNTTKNLQSSNGEKSKQDIEDESKLYEELRQKMSTKEFVEQYGAGLSND